MKLQQLRYLVAIVDNGLNITAAADSLFTSQPGVSKQVKMLEDELSLQLFVRKGKSLSSLTDAGKQVVHRARRILSDAENIKQLSRDLAGQVKGELAIATTHTQARYVLPDLLEMFQREHKGISLRLHQGTSEQIASQVQEQEADFAIASGESALFEDLVTMPIYSWERVILVRPMHPLAKQKKVSLQDLSHYPLISYTCSFNEESSLTREFKNAGINPNVVFTAQDADVIKTYVRKGMGVGIVACMAYDEEKDSDLVAINAADLFPSCTTWVGFRKDRFLRNYMYDFLKLVVPNASRESIDEAITAATVGAPGKNALVLPFPEVNKHPGFNNQFSSCCNGS